MRKMIAKTSFNDFVGTSAADFEDQEKTIEAFFREQGGDVTRFEPIGTSFYLASNNSVGIKFFCIDKWESHTDESNVLLIDGAHTIPFNEYFRMFKSLSVVLLREHYKDYEVTGSIDLG
ncbi:hypothetical protein [Spirosoma koreense]